MSAVAILMADPQLEFHWLPDPGFLIQGFPAVSDPYRGSPPQLLWLKSCLVLRRPTTTSHAMARLAVAALALLACLGGSAAEVGETTTGVERRLETTTGVETTAAAADDGTTAPDVVGAAPRAAAPAVPLLALGAALGLAARR